MGARDTGCESLSGLAVYFHDLVATARDPLRAGTSNRLLDGTSKALCACAMRAGRAGFPARGAGVRLRLRPPGLAPGALTRLAGEIEQVMAERGPEHEFVGAAGLSAAGCGGGGADCGVGAGRADSAELIQATAQSHLLPAMLTVSPTLGTVVQVHRVTVR